MLFWQFAHMTTYMYVVWKKLDKHFNLPLFSYPRDKVLIIAKSMGQICPLDFLLFRTLTPGSKNIINWNGGPAFFQQPWYTWSCRKSARTTFQCILVLQSIGQYSYSCWNSIKPGSQSATYPQFWVFQKFCLVQIYKFWGWFGFLRWGLFTIVKYVKITKAAQIVPIKIEGTNKLKYHNILSSWTIYLVNGYFYIYFPMFTC